MPFACASPSKKQLATLASLAGHPRINTISRDFPCIKSGLLMKYEYEYLKKGHILKLIFNQPLTELECGRIIYAIRKRLKRATQHYNQPKNSLARKINDVLYKLRFSNIFGYTKIYRNKKLITRHVSNYGVNDVCPGSYSYDDDDDCECSLALRKGIRPTGKILRFLSRKQAQDEKFAKRQKEIQGLISLAETLYDLHRQNHLLFNGICPTLPEKVEYICKLIKLYCEKYTTRMGDENSLISVIAFYIKVLDNNIAAIPIRERQLLLQPFNHVPFNNVYNVLGRSVGSVVQYLFTTKYINNEAPNILVALENTRCRVGWERMCNACDAFWKNTSMCQRSYGSQKCRWNCWTSNNYCMCDNTSERPGTNTPCQKWTYTPPAPRKAYDYDDNDDYY